MLIKLNKKRVKEVLEKYYKEEFDCDGKVTISVSKGACDYYERFLEGRRMNHGGG